MINNSNLLANCENLAGAPLYILFLDKLLDDCFCLGFPQADPETRRSLTSYLG